MNLFNFGKKTCLCRSTDEIVIADGKLEHLVVDTVNTGNVARFINHSCEPNLTSQVVFTVKSGQSMFHTIGFFNNSSQDIPPMTELTYNYKWNGGEYGGMACTCGAPTCRGTLWD